MSLFSSLEYLLTKAAVNIHNTTLIDPPQDVIFAENNFTSKLFEIRSNENSTINTTNYSENLHTKMIPGKLSIETVISKPFRMSTAEKWANLSSLYPSTLKTFLRTDDLSATENQEPYLNETFPDAEYLFESWWNIFDPKYLKHGWGWTITLITAYLLILVVGVIGNLVVILVVLMRPQMRTVTNLFIMNLAVADFFVIVFCVPSTLLANIFAPWILGSFMCKSVAYVQGVSGCASAYSLAAISLDRCQAIYRNCERPRGFSRTTCVRTVFIIWITALSLTAPWAVIFNVRVSDYDGLRYCVETWEVEKHGNIYFLVINLGCFYSIPLLLIFVSNWIIYCHVAHRNVPEDSVSSAPIRKMHRETKHHVLKMLGIITLTFLFCWLPVYILVIIIKFSQNISESENNVLGILMPVAQWLGSWNSSINPILYAFLNKRFRQMVRSILPSWFPFKADRKYMGFCKAPTFTPSACRRKWIIVSRPNGNIDHNHLNRQNNFHNQTTVLISRFDELTGKVVTTTVHIISTTAVLSSFSQNSK